MSPQRASVGGTGTVFDLIQPAERPSVSLGVRSRAVWAVFPRCRTREQFAVGRLARACRHLF